MNNTDTKMVSANKEYKLSGSTIPFNEWIEEFNKKKKEEFQKQQEETSLNADGDVSKDGKAPTPGDHSAAVTKVTILGLTPANWALIGVGLAVVGVIWYAYKNNSTTPVTANV